MLRRIKRYRWLFLLNDNQLHCRWGRKCASIVAAMVLEGPECRISGNEKHHHNNTISSSSSYNIIIIIKNAKNNNNMLLFLYLNHTYNPPSWIIIINNKRTRQREHVEQGAHSLVVYSRLGCGLNTHGAMTSVVEAQDSDGGMNDAGQSMRFVLPTYRANTTIHRSLRNVKKEREQNRLFRVKSIYYDYLYLKSILRDLQIKSVSNETSSENSCNYDLHNCNIKVYANLRNGLWYYPSFDGTSCFKSTDGHSYKWNLVTNA